MRGLVLSFALACSAVAAAGCTDDGPGGTCAAGSTQACLCADGEAGAQSCADDGERWLACDCGGGGADGDGDVDSDADQDGGTDGGCVGGCPAEGDARCVGDVLWRCRTDPEGCLEWTVEIDCGATARTCETTAAGAACRADGRCSQTGEPCTDLLPCPAATVAGFCVGNDAWMASCGYDNRFAEGETADCAGTTVHRCEGDFDCPTGAWCGEGPASECGAYFVGLCQTDSLGECTAAGCVLGYPNECVTCGNGVVEGPQEECDDGNADAGDGCSDTCAREGVCEDASGAPASCDCAVDEDCLRCSSECTPEAPCTCRIP